MSLIPKSYHKRITLFCLCLICLCMTGLPLTSHAAVDSATVTLRVNQTFKNNSAFTSVNSVIHYELLPLEAGNPLPSGSSGSLYSFTIDGTTSFDLGPITFTQIGTYHYQIKENFSSWAGYTIDKQVYSVTVYVRKSDQKNLIADIIIYKSDSSKSGEIKFNHSYTASGSRPVTMADPPVQKTVSGNPSTASTFVFLLTARDLSNPMPANSVNGKKTITIDGSGQKSFGTWEYTREGTYYYTISEVNTGEIGYTYDSAVYTITDVVMDTNGQLNVRRTVTNQYNKLVESFIFINKYSGNGGSTNTPGDNSSSTNTPGDNSSSTNTPGDNSSSTNKPSDNSGSGNSSGSNSSGGNSSGNNNGSSTNGPQTGDDARNQLYATIIIIAGMVATICILYLAFAGSRRKEDTEKPLISERDG